MGKPNVPVTNTQQLAYVLIKAKPTGAMADVQMPLNFSLVLDHSGSMAGDKLRNLKEAVKLVLDQMQPQDYVSLIIFDDKAQVVSPSQPVTNKAHLKSLVDGIKDGGGTEMSKGMKLGLAEVQKALNPSHVSRVLLLTDGQTFGDEDKCQQLGGDAGRLGSPITALGLGDDWNAELLDAIANASGGVSDFIDAPHKIHQHFQSTVRSMQATVVSNAQLVLRLVGGITPRQVWRVIPLISQLSPTALSDRDVQVHLGDLEKEQGQAVLVELLLPPRSAGHYRIAQAEVSYDVPAAGVVGEKARSDILLTFTGDPTLAQQYDPRVMSLVEKVTAFKLQTRALDEAKAGNIAGATQKLRAAATRLLEMGEAELAAAAEEEAKRLEQGQAMSAAGTKKLQYETRKLTQKLDQ
jgi:Ca-activated chloride channel family protein